MDLNVRSYCIKILDLFFSLREHHFPFLQCPQESLPFINSSSPAYPICSCDADPAALAKYVVALLRKDKPKSALKELCIDQLEVFLAKGKLCTYGIKLCNSYRIQKLFVYMFYKEENIPGCSSQFLCVYLVPKSHPASWWSLVHIQPHLRNRDRRFV